MTDLIKNKPVKPVFRNPDKVQVLTWREWMREELPAPREGMVIEDLDLLVLRFGSLECRNYKDDGKFLLAEVKIKDAQINYAQQRVWKLLHTLLRKSDTNQSYYQGFYLIQWFDLPKEDNKNFNFFVKVNDRKLEIDDFKAFLLGKVEIKSLFD